MDKLVFEGNTDDLLYISEDNKIKSTRLFLDLADDNADNAEIVDVSITSSSENEVHSTFNALIGKKLKVTVEICDDDEE